jgi:hypothetical protein
VLASATMHLIGGVKFCKSMYVPLNAAIRDETVRRLKKGWRWIHSKSESS